MGENAKKAQKHAARIIGNPKFGDAMSKLEDDESARDEVRRDPAGWLQRQGIEIPEEAEITVEPGSFCITINLWLWAYRVCF